MSREQQVRDALARFLAAVRKATDSHLATLSTELIAILRTDAPAGGDGAAELLAGMREIDDATSLRGVLDALAAGAARHAADSGVLLVDRAMARPYRYDGFAPDRAPVDTSVGESGTLARAMAAQAAVIAHGGDDPAAPAFLSPPDGHVLLLVPIVVAQQVVAMAHAGGPAAGPPGSRTMPDWAAFVEALARHASAKLENVTSKRTVEVLGKG